MRIALVLTPPTDRHFRWAAQIGVSDFVCRYPRHYGLEPLDGLALMKSRAESFGLNLTVVEGYLPMQRIILGEKGRDDDIAELTRFIRHMGKLGVEILCYNFMPRFDWTRTSFEVPTRGGAVTSGFDLSQVRAPAACGLAPEQMWSNLQYFLERVAPVAEEARVKLAAHPDDPPLPEFLGASQILCSPEAFERLFAIAPNPANGICFCQGTFAEMGVDIPATIKKLGRWIHYVHFRDVRGDAQNFVETFHDDGPTDMAAAMRAYREIAFAGPMRPDHVPKLHGEEGVADGYTMLGRLFAVGYMRGLIDSLSRYSGRGQG